MSRLLPSLALTAALALAACTTIRGSGAPEIPEGAEQVTRVEANGDRITEYRVGGQLRVVYVVPSRGPAYYLYDQGGKPGSSADNPPQVWFKLFGW